MAACIPEFAPGIDVVARWHRIPEGVHLDIAAVVKRTIDRGCIVPDSSICQPPSGATQGGGATIGPYFLDFCLPQRVLRVDGVAFLTMPAQHNVVLLIEEPHELRLVATHEVSPSLHVQYADKAHKAGAILTAVRSALNASGAVTEFIGSSY